MPSLSPLYRLPFWQTRLKTGCLNGYVSRFGRQPNFYRFRRPPYLRGRKSVFVVQGPSRNQNLNIASVQYIIITRHCRISAMVNTIACEVTQPCSQESLVARNEMDTNLDQSKKHNTLHKPLVTLRSQNQGSISDCWLYISRSSKRSSDLCIPSGTSRMMVR